MFPAYPSILGYTAAAFARYMKAIIGGTICTGARNRMSWPHISVQPTGSAKMAIFSIYAGLAPPLGIILKSELLLLA